MNKNVKILEHALINDSLHDMNPFYLNQCFGFSSAATKIYHVFDTSLCNVLIYYGMFPISLFKSNSMLL